MQITSQKSRKRANRDLQFIADQIRNMEKRRDEEARGYDLAMEALNQQADDIRSAMAAYDSKGEEG